MCTVYNIGKFLETSFEKRAQSVFDVPLKKRKILVTSEDPAKEFVSADFCPKNERHIVTVSSRAEPRVIIWNWDKQKIISFVDIPKQPNQIADQVSFSSIDPGVVIVTGAGGFYRYLKLDGQNLKIIPNVIHRRDNEAHFSDNYTCHAMLADGRFVICNDLGQIILLDHAGEFKGITVSDNRKDTFPITAITTFQGVSNEATGAAAGQGKAAGGAKSGFIVAGESGRIRVFVKSDVDPKKPYERVASSDDIFLDPQIYLADKTQLSQMILKDIEIQQTTAIALSP